MHTGKYTEIKSLRADLKTVFRSGAFPQMTPRAFFEVFLDITR
jgi:hypothetical protein